MSLGRGTQSPAQLSRDTHFRCPQAAPLDAAEFGAASTRSGHSSGHSSGDGDAKETCAAKYVDSAVSAAAVATAAVSCAQGGGKAAQQTPAVKSNPILSARTSAVGCRAAIFSAAVPAMAYDAPKAACGAWYVEAVVSGPPEVAGGEGANESAPLPPPSLMIAPSENEGTFSPDSLTEAVSFACFQNELFRTATSFVQQERTRVSAHPVEPLSDDELLADEEPRSDLPAQPREGACSPKSVVSGSTVSAATGTTATTCREALRATHFAPPNPTETSQTRANLPR